MAALKMQASHHASILSPFASLYMAASSSRSSEVIKEIVMVWAASLAISLILGVIFMLYRLPFSQTIR